MFLHGCQNTIKSLWGHFTETGAGMNQADIAALRQTIPKELLFDLMRFVEQHEERHRRRWWHTFHPIVGRTFFHRHMREGMYDLRIAMNMGHLGDIWDFIYENLQESHESEFEAYDRGRSPAVDSTEQLSLLCQELTRLMNRHGFSTPPLVQEKLQQQKPRPLTW